ncbi:MAG: fibronectin type III domain-containing protein, partial [Thermoplasmata archaeon]
MGTTLSYDYPTTPGAFNRSLNGIDGGVWRDGFITRVDSKGNITASTFLGGNRRDIISDIEVLEDGDVLVVGYTNSTDFPTTPSAMNRTFIGGERDVFIALLDANLTNVKYASFFGGDGYDGSSTLAVDGSGRVYVCGVTSSSDLPTSIDAYQRSHSNASVEEDLFVAGFSPSLDSLTFCTYLGGDGNESTPICDLDSEGNIVTSGLTDGTGMPVTTGAYDTKAAGVNESFLAIISNDGRSLMACTYIGGDGADRIAAVLLNRTDTVYITGATDSKDWDFNGLNGPNPTRLPRLDEDDSFVMALDPDLTTCTFGTFLGGSEGDLGLDITLDDSEELLYFIGLTGSTDIAMNCTKGAYDKKFRGGLSDLFVSTIDLTDGTIDYTSLLGGRDDEQVTLAAQVLDVDDEGVIHFTFETKSDDIPTTMNAACHTFSGGEWDMVVASLNPRPCPVPEPLNVTAIEGKGWINFTWELPPYEMCRLDCVKVFKGIEPDDSEKLRETVPLGIMYFNETIAISRNITHYFWFRLKNTAGLSELQEPIEWLPLERATVPRDLVAWSGDSNVTLNWSRPLDDGGEVSGYHVFRGPDDSTVDDLIATLGPDALSYNDTIDMVNGTTLHYGVRAFNIKHNGTISFTRSLVWGPPTVPRLVVGDPGDTNVTLSWRPPKSDGGINISGYRVWRSTNLVNWTLTPGPVGPETVYTDVNRMNNVTYHYRVAAYHDRADGPNATTIGHTPFGRPGPPENLTVTPGEGFITIRWTPPLDGNGMDPYVYIVYYGTDTRFLNSSMASVGTRKVHQVPTLNVTFYYMVTAKNDAGESISTEKLPGLALDRPGTPTDFELDRDDKGMMLTWKRPVNDGGHGILRFDVYKLSTDGGFINIENVTNREWYLDEEVDWGINYSYYLKVNNTMYESDPTSTMTFEYTTFPGEIDSLLVVQYRTWFNITWGYPDEDGGKKVTMFELYWYSIDDDLVEQSSNSTGFFYVNETHYGLIPGREYHYRVMAKNDNGWGPWSDYVSVVFKALPSSPIVSAEVVEKEYIVINWTMPLRANCTDCTGYQVFRGEKEDELDLVANVTIGRSWTDYDVVEGGTYWYRVVAVSPIGLGNPSEVLEVKIPEDGPGPSPTTLLIAAVIILVMSGTAFILYSRSRKRDISEETPTIPAGEVVVEPASIVPVPPWSRSEEEPTTAHVAPVAAPQSDAAGLLPYIVEEVFVVYADGRMITSCAREECGTADADLMSGMLIAIQGLIQDGLESGGRLESIKYGENLISLASGDHVVVAAVVYGRPDDQLQEDLKKTVSNIEGTYAGIIEEWTGDPSAMAGLDDLVMPLIDKTAYLTRDNVGDVLADHGVALLSAVDFHRGYVRLKMAAVNATYDTIIDSAVEVHYDDDMLRMERVEPDSIVIRGDRVTLGNILPGERKTVALLFDPQIC